VEEYEPKVVSQMLEFTYRYVTSTLQDAKYDPAALFCSISILTIIIIIIKHRTYSSHAEKTEVDDDDVKLAMNMRQEVAGTSSSVGSLPRNVLFETAKQTNSQPLPSLIKDSKFRLPLDRHCLLAPNFRVKK
jgi:hypothetical protein